jgi:uncharacterized membrane protein
VSTIARDRIRQAIDAAERGTTGRIAVRIFNGHTENALDEARKHFEKQRLHHHQHRSGVLFLVAPRARKFAVLGDQAIHERVGDAFWKKVVDEMQPYFAKGQTTEALELGIARMGEAFRSC